MSSYLLNGFKVIDLRIIKKANESRLRVTFSGRYSRIANSFITLFYLSGNCLCFVERDYYNFFDLLFLGRNIRQTK